MQRRQHGERVSYDPQRDAPEATPEHQRRADQNLDQIEEEKHDTGLIVPAEIAILTIRLTDCNVIEAIQLSRNSPQAGRYSDEIFKAFGGIGGARRHLA